MAGFIDVETIVRTAAKRHPVSEDTICAAINAGKNALPDSIGVIDAIAAAFLAEMKPKKAHK